MTPPRPDVVLVFGGRSSEHNATKESARYVLTRLQATQRQHGVVSVAYIAETGLVTMSAYNPVWQVENYVNAEGPITLGQFLDHVKSRGLFLFGVMYGQNGEDGRFQGATELFAIESNLTGVLPSALATNKSVMSSWVAASQNIVKTPPSWVLDRPTRLAALTGVRDHDRIVVKPNSLGSSILTERFSTTADDLAAAEHLVTQILDYDDQALVQAYIPGIEYSIGCLEDGDRCRVLSPVAITTESGFFGQREKFIPGNVTETVLTDDVPEAVRAAQTFAVATFTTLGFRNHARFDFIVNGAGSGSSRPTRCLVSSPAACSRRCCRPTAWTSTISSRSRAETPQHGPPCGSATASTCRSDPRRATTAITRPTGERQALTHRLHGPGDPRCPKASFRRSTGLRYVARVPALTSARPAGQHDLRSA